MPNPTAPLDVARVRSMVAQTRFSDVRYIARTASTNADAAALLGDRTAQGTTIVADYQSAGAGRKGRRWFAPPGAALLFTAILPQPVEANTMWAVPFWIATNVALAVEQQCGVRLDLVWPNDVHARGAKVGGILSVARVTGHAAYVGCGVGLNVLRPQHDPDLAGLSPQPVFLDELSATVAREALLAQILTCFDRSLDDLHDPDLVARRWEERADLAGTMYRYRNDADGIEREGVARRIGVNGALVLAGADGVEAVVDMADVRVIGHVRD